MNVTTAPATTRTRGTWRNSQGIIQHGYLLGTRRTGPHGAESTEYWVVPFCFADTLAITLEVDNFTPNPEAQ